MRKLVTIRKIDEIHQIPNADLIERAKIGGWNVVVKKGEFAAGDFCVYGEIDSIFPADDERFSFLQGKPLKTKKMRGVVSQGIAFPVSILDNSNVSIGDEVTEKLGVTKYEPPPPKAVEAKGAFPWFVPKTDAERVQNLVEELKDNLGETAYVSEKLDGSSITIFCRNNEGVWETGVCSRNLELKLEVSNHFTETVKRLNVLERLQNFCELNKRQIALQGELTGLGIQGNKYNLIETDIYFFNLYDISEGRKVMLNEFVEVVETLEFKTVPILEDAYKLHTDVEKYLQDAEGKSQLNNKTNREGIVIRTLNGEFDFKAISNRFLLKN